MNMISGIIKRVTSDQLFMKIDIQCMNHEFSACVIQSDNTQKNLTAGEAITMLFKETDTIISVNSDLKISCRNRLPSIVHSITSGPVLTRICTDFNGFKITALITTDSYNLLNIKIGDTVTCLVKSTSVMLTSSRHD